MNPSYVFTGLRPHNRAAALRAGMDLGDSTTLQHLGRSEESWHAKQIQQALGSLPGLVADAEAGRIAASNPAEAYARLQALHASLAVLKDAAGAAIVEAASNLGLEPPAFLARAATTNQPATESESEPKNDGTTDEGGGDAGRLGDDLGAGQGGGAEGPPRQPDRAQSRKK